MPDGEFNLQEIDIQTLPPEHWDTVLRQATRRARVERSLVCRDLAERGWRGALAWARRVLSTDRPSGYAG